MVQLGETSAMSNLSLKQKIFSINYKQYKTPENLIDVKAVNIFSSNYKVSSQFTKNIQKTWFNKYVSANFLKYDGTSVFSSENIKTSVNKNDLSKNKNTKKSTQTTNKDKILLTKQKDELVEKYKSNYCESDKVSSESDNDVNACHAKVKKSIKRKRCNSSSSFDTSCNLNDVADDIESKFSRNSTKKRKECNEYVEENQHQNVKKTKKKKISRSLNDNYVLLNKKKCYARGCKKMSSKQMKWKRFKKNSGKCFKCKGTGHWAKDCKV